MTILFCGKFNPLYNRTRIIIKGLEKTGIEVLVYAWNRKKHINKAELKNLLSKADVVFLPSFTHTDLPFVRRLTQKPILFDPLISRYLSKVFDYKTISKYSPRAYKNFLKDSRSLNAANLIISDTLAHKNYYVDKFGIDPEKIKVVPVGVISEDFFPVQFKRKLSTKLTVGFYGSFIPLHGVDILVKAAEILKDDTDIQFRLIGEGVLMKKILTLVEERQLTNIEFTGWTEYDDLNEEINKFDIALGIFGSSLKAKMVIPNKIFHYAACEKAIISMESDGIREIFTDNKNIILTKNNPKDLASAIIRLKDKTLRQRISAECRTLVKENYNEIKIARSIMDFIFDYL